MSVKTVYIVPTRGRPENADALMTAWKETTTEAYLHLCVDNDDPELEGYREVWSRHVQMWQDSGSNRDDDRMMITVGERLRLGGTLNDVSLTWVNMGADIIGFMGDDHRPCTPGWDVKIREAMESMGGTGVVYGNDLLQRAALPTAVAISSDVVKALGYYVPPGAVHLYLDNAWRDMGLAMGRLKYLDDVIIEHMHPVAGKAQMDAGYTEVNSGEMYAADEKVYNAWKAEGEYVRILQKLVGVK